MRECKEVLRLAVNERQKYIARVRTAIYDPEADRDFVDAFEQDMEDFDQNLTLTLECYLSYLQVRRTLSYNYSETCSNLHSILTELCNHDSVRFVLVNLNLPKEPFGGRMAVHQGHLSPYSGR